MPINTFLLTHQLFAVDLQFCQNNKGVCKNNGKCENARSPSGQPYRCTCPSGFRGDHCEIMQLDCLSHGCRNGGQCTQHMDGQVGLVFTKCWYSKLNSRLIFHFLFQSRCICPKGYYGNLCEFNQTVCSEHPCQGQKTVVNSTAPVHQVIRVTTVKLTLMTVLQSHVKMVRHPVLFAIWTIRKI